RRTPKLILTAQSADQFANISRDHRPPGPSMPDFPGPEQSEALSMPGDYCFRLNDQKSGSPAILSAAQPGPKKPICRSELRPLHRALQDSKLVPQREILQLERSP